MAQGKAIEAKIFTGEKRAAELCEHAEKNEVLVRPFRYRIAYGFHYYYFVLETESHHVGHDGIDLLTSSSARLSLPKCWDSRHKPHAGPLTTLLTPL